MLQAISRGGVHPNVINRSSKQSRTTQSRNTQVPWTAELIAEMVQLRSTLAASLFEVISRKTEQELADLRAKNARLAELEQIRSKTIKATL